MSLKGEVVLVTGADGFIGSHLVERLVGAGAHVKALCCYNSFNSLGWVDSFSAEVRQHVTPILGDIRDPNGVANAMHGCSYVFHLAALISIQFSYISPDSYIDTNVRGTLNVLQAARKTRPKRVIVTSTSEVYGSALKVPISEDHPLQAQSPYAASKTAADQLALSFFRSFELPVLVLRPFNTYGPRQSTRAVIPTAITQIASGATKISLGATSPTRDFSHVLDTAQGFVDAALSPAHLNGSVVNLGSGFEISIGDTVNLIAKILDRKNEIVSSAERIRPDKSEVQRLFADNTLASTQMGYRPAYGGMEGFERGLKATIEWFRDPENLARYAVDRYAV
jgi:dTDP-glucose 4,6-dehydratase